MSYPVHPSRRIFCGYLLALPWALGACPDAPPSTLTVEPTDGHSLDDTPTPTIEAITPPDVPPVPCDPTASVVWTHRLPPW